VHAAEPRARGPRTLAARSAKIARNAWGVQGGEAPRLLAAQRRFLRFLVMGRQFPCTSVFPRVILEVWVPDSDLIFGTEVRIRGLDSGFGVRGFEIWIRGLGLRIYLLHQNHPPLFHTVRPRAAHGASGGPPPDGCATSRGMVPVEQGPEFRATRVFFKFLGGTDSGGSKICPNQYLRASNSN
jgi:hypothetical protein